MSAVILHVGEETDPCLPYLRQNGYTIHCYQRSLSFDQVPQSGTECDLVSLTDTEHEEFRLAAAQARTSLLVPTVLFQMRTAIQLLQVKEPFAHSDLSDFDLVISANHPPQLWKPKLDALVALCRRLRNTSNRIIENSLRLNQETAGVIGKARFETERAKRLCEQIDVSMPISNMLADRVLKCRTCGERFVFPAGEQLMFQLRRETHIPDRCDRCKVSPVE